MFRGDQPMLMNSGNAEYTGDDSLGNYQLVDSGDGNTQIARFNIPGDVDGEDCYWASHGALAERPDLSVLQQVDALNGILDLMSNDLLEELGYDVTEPNRYAGVPTNIDLKTFGDRVLQSENDIDVLESRSWNQSNFYQEVEVDLNGDFSAGTIKVARVGSMITVSCVGAQTTCTNQASPATNAIIPTWARPPNSQGSLYYSDSNGNYRMTCLNSGVIAFDFRNHAGAAVNRTNAFNNWTISYTV